MTIYRLELSDDDVNAIGRALDEMPYKVVHGVAQRLQQQITNQNIAEFNARVAVREAQAVERALAAAKVDEPAEPPPKTNGSRSRKPKSDQDSAG